MSVPNAAPVVQAPAAPQTNEEAIGSFARDFLGELDANDDPEALDPNEAPVETQPQEPDPIENPEPEAETPPQPEIPMVEVELDDGEKVLVPEKVKHRMMADKDYRQKTMALSADRKQVEQHLAKAAELAQQAQQMAPYHAQLHQMDSRAAYLDQALRTDPALAADPLEWNKAQGELAILLRNRDHFAAGLQQQQAQFTAQQLELRAQQLALDAPELFKAFPELQKPETQAKLNEYVKAEGLPQEAIAFLNYSAAGVKMAHKARLYDEMVAEQAKSRAKLSEKVKTLPAATPSSRAAEGGVKTKQLESEWKKDGGKINSPAFDALLRAKIRGK